MALGFAAFCAIFSGVLGFSKFITPRDLETKQALSIMAYIFGTAWIVFGVIILIAFFFGVIKREEDHWIMLSLFLLVITILFFFAGGLLIGSTFSQTIGKISCFVFGVAGLFMFWWLEDAETPRSPNGERYN
jgi:hypothetical protein